MNLLLAWNELSEHPQAADRQTAIERMNRFVDAFAALRSRVNHYVQRPTLRCRYTLDEVELAPDYRIANWRVDTDRDRKKLFLLVVTASPVLPSQEQGGTAEQHGSEAKHEGRRAEGLHGAWWWDGVAMSLASADCWEKPNVPISVEQLDDHANIAVSPATVRHVSKREHVDAHAGWLEEEARKTISGTADLWARREALFPHLELCGEVEGRLRSFDDGSPHFRQIVLRLFELENAFAEWDGAPIHPDFLPTKCTPETPQTLCEEEADHTATRASGVKEVFSWHVRFTPDAGRIFFSGDSDSDPKRGVIGYIGLKKGDRLT